MELGDSGTAPFSGTAAHQSALLAGIHEHSFWNATNTVEVLTGDILFSYLYLDPTNPPREIMIEWSDGCWEHRAFWGDNLIQWGEYGRSDRLAMGDLPPAGQWVRLAVPASALQLEGAILKGMRFTLYDGRATWDCAGRQATSVTNTTLGTIAAALPMNNATISGIIAVSGDASDAVRADGGQFRLAGADIGAEITNAPGRNIWDTTTRPDDRHTLTAVIRGATSRQTTSVPVTVGSPNHAPATSLPWKASRAAFPAEPAARPATKSCPTRPDATRGVLSARLLGFHLSTTIRVLDLDCEPECFRSTNT